MNFSFRACLPLSGLPSSSDQILNLAESKRIRAKVNWRT